MLRGWWESLALVWITASLCCSKKAGGGGGEVLDILSTVGGTYTKLLDDDLSMTLSYNLEDDSRVPLSFITGVGFTKGQDIYRRSDPTDPIARLTLSGSILAKGRVPSGGFVLDAKDRTMGINVNHALRRAQFRFGRSFLDGRFKVGLSPLVTYGSLRRSSVDFGNWVPSYRPPLSGQGMPSMSVQQRDVVWDWAQGMPSRSSLHGVGISMRLQAGRRGSISATLYDARNRSRLWSLRAEAPLAKPLDIYLSADRAWQVRTTDDTPPQTSPRRYL